ETTGIPVEHVVAGVAGAHLRGVNSRGGIALGARAREVTRDDVRQAVERARAISLPDDRQILHLLPQQYILDEQDGIHDPTGVVPIGGDHFTNDVAVGLRTPLADAEKIKRSFGCAVVTRIAEDNEIEVPAVGDRPSRLMPQRLLGEVLEPRARELFEMLRDA